MKYRTNPHNGDKLSQLGFGCMRFNRDKKEVEKELLYAIENGVNYFDTAYIYPNNEATLGSILAKHNLREKVYIATKIPPFMIKKTAGLDKLFKKELERLQTDYIDYYFIHMLTDVNEWNRLVDLGVLDWIKAKKDAGEIRNIGFSYHGSKKPLLNWLTSMTGNSA